MSEELLPTAEKTAEETSDDIISQPDTSARGTEISENTQPEPAKDENIKKPGKNFKKSKKSKKSPEKSESEISVEEKEPGAENIPEDGAQIIKNAAEESEENPDSAAENPENPEAPEAPEETKNAPIWPKELKNVREPLDFKKILLNILTALSAFGKFSLEQAKIGAGVAAKYSKIIGAELVRVLSGIGKNAAEIIGKGAKAAGKGMAVGAKESVKTVGKTGGGILKIAFTALSRVGKTAWQVLSAIAVFVFKLIRSFLLAVFGAVFGWIGKKFKQPFLEAVCFIVTPFAHAWGGAASAWIRLKKAWKKGPFHVIGAILSSLWGLVCAFVEILRFAFNYIAPVVCVAFLVALIRYYSTLQYGISVTYNGSDIGTIENEATFNEAQTLIQDKVTFTENDQPILVTPKFSVTVMNLDGEEKQPVDDVDQLSETMIEQGDVEIVYAYGLYINDELFGVYSVEDMETIRAALEERLNSYSAVNAVNVFFEDDIVFSEGRYLKDVLSEPDEALELITGGTEVEAYYVVQRGDTISGICEKLGITREEYEADNPDLTEKIRHDDIVTYHYIEPHLNVLTTYYEVYGQVIERTTEYVETSRREEYCEILLQHGSDGYENVTALVTLKNGVESNREIVSRNIIEEMVPRKFRVGTKPNTYLNGDTEIIDTLGTFCWPLGDEDCYISTMPGWRSWDSSNHMALDIAGIPAGTDIYAACDGKVTFSGWYGAYGKLVIVDCGHGYECYYGHCSELLVSEGDRVEKGDVIAEVGMTGSASGNHLHFEMRRYDSRINPLKALGGTGGHEIRE